MMRLYLFILAFFLVNIPSVFASHISGGEVYYRYVGPGDSPNADKFVLTLRLFRDENISGDNIASMPATATLGIFTQTAINTYSNYKTISGIARLRKDRISITPSAYPCIIPAPLITYEIGYYEYTIDLPKSEFGYMVAFQTCCRTSGIANMISFPIGRGTFGDGATYATIISGTNVLGGGTNSGPSFKIKDTAIVCANNRFEIDLSAVDPNSDSLSYSFCSAYNRGTSVDANEGHSPSTPPYQVISYTDGFSGSMPLGNNVTIDPETGLISGVAPAAGKYVVNVCIDEWRDQQKIGEHRKDFILEVKSCNIAGASLDPTYITCDGLTLTFENLSTSPLVKSYYWDFGVTGTTTDISTEMHPTYTFPVAGEYPVKLVVNRNEQCTDSAITIAKVYPGFYPDYRVDGSCILNNFNFIDNSSTLHGVINKWKWNLGDETTTTDISTQTNTTWKYTTTGIKEIECIIESSLGCVDTIIKTIEVRDRPLITMPFRDTLICSVDTLTLRSSGLGVSYWTPDVVGLTRFNNTANPEVFPKTTTTFTLTLDDNGCVSTDSIKVRVVNEVTLDAGADKTICLTDPVTLTPSGDGLYFEWTPAITLDDATKRNPVAIPTAESTTYRVLAKISEKCVDEDFLTVRTVPYPIASAGDDVIICYDDTTGLTGSMDGSYFEWTPTSTLLNSITLTPLAYPLRTTSYVLSVWDNKGCPKPGRDTIVVTVRPEILANAGRDTSIVVGQPLLLNATGAALFEWSPATGLSNPNISTPTATVPDDMSYIVKVYTSEGCYDYDTINIKVFETVPNIFVPNAFTPGSGSNARFRPIPVGIAKMDYFRVYNRWGQLVYSSTDTVWGWDGKINGKEQSPGAYVWMAAGTDYTGKRIYRKGTLVLLR